MKTPRDILLARHRAAESKLDTIRQATVSAVCDHRHPDAADKRAEPGATSILLLLWRELIVPGRRIWAGLATIWILIIIVNFSQRDRAELMAGETPSLSPQAIQVLWQQERLLAEGNGPVETKAAPPAPKPLVPRPSGERRFEMMRA